MADESTDALLAAIRRGSKRAAGSGRPEAVLREEVQPALAKLLAAGGSRSSARDEFRLSVPMPSEAHELDAPLVTFGRADAIYNRFVIEFEPPGSLRPSLLHSSTRHAVTQVQQYLRGLSKQARLPLERLAGCAFDGSWIVYVSLDVADWRVSRPRRVDADALGALLATMKSLSSGRGLTAENLAEDFGPDSDVAAVLVPALASVLTKEVASERAHAFFAQWILDLGNASGLPSHFDIPDWQELCSSLHVSSDSSRQLEVLFALQTYFGIIAKLVSLVVLEGATGQELLSGLTRGTNVLKGFEGLESGALTASTGALNAIEPGIFSWYVSSQAPSLEAALHQAALVAAEYSAEVVEVTPLGARDLMKDLFQRLLPQSLRHRLGEYYTPDWLAEFVLDEVGYAGDPTLTLLDPACGSGTFLVLAIGRIRAWFEAHRDECGFDEVGLLQRILQSVTGFDLSPLAVMAARTNYLIAVRDLLRDHGSIEIPVYLCDSVHTPVEYGDLFTGGLGRTLELKTSAGAFLVPREVTRDRDTMATYTDLLRNSIENRHEEDHFIEDLDASSLPSEDTDLHRQLYRQLWALAKAGINGIWANIIRNSFAPLLQGRVDFVVGNPPWVFWNTLPQPYRDEIRQVMVDHYGLSTGGESTMRRLGSAGKDLSALFVYVAIDRYLNQNGRLSFVITQTLFQTTAGDEFRRWKLPDGTPIGITQVDDFVKVRPFSAAANKTATFVAVRGAETAYPVRYRVWEPAGRFSRDSASLSDVRSLTTIREAWAHPADPRRKGSLWLISDSKAQSAPPPATNSYRVRRGVEATPESVYRVRILDLLPNGLALIENVRDRAKIVVPEVRAEIEAALLYPYITGSSVTRWGVSYPGHYVIPHTQETGMKPIAEAAIRADWPLTYKYLTIFRELLADRSLHKRWGKDHPFYSLYDIGPYTFAPWKVVWKRSTRTFAACVVSSANVGPQRNGVVVPNGNLMTISFSEPNEAHYVCAVLNSSLARLRINSALTTKAHAEILDLISLPSFDRTNPTHMVLAELSERCHSARAGQEDADLKRAELGVDELVADMWNVGSEELEHSRAQLAK
jgi:Eco57I restriction-modification methylase